MVQPDREIVRDIRLVTARDLEGFDCVMHLAAISNDPMGDLDPEITRAVNARGSIALARSAKAAGVPRFLFSSSLLDLWQDRRPSARRGRSAEPGFGLCRVEDRRRTGHCTGSADKNFAPAYLRNATAYGHSPMLRIDLVVNNLLGCAVARGDIRIISDGSPWRPLIHCKDIARAFVAFLEAPRAAISNQSVNVGGDAENYQVRDIAGEVERLVAGATIVYTGEGGKDPRDYRVDFSKLGRLLPDFRLEYDLAAGMEELLAQYRDHGFSAADFDGDRFVRLRTLRHRLDRLALPPERKTA